MQLSMYSLDMHANYSTYLLIFNLQKGSIEALNFFFFSQLPYRLHYGFNHKFLHVFHHRFHHKLHKYLIITKVNSHWGCNCLNFNIIIFYTKVP